MNFEIPNEIRGIGETLTRAGFSAYLVGGCVRDMLLKKSPHGSPKDWDIATDAKPDEVQKLFEDHVYENNFGTVGIKTESADPALKIVEVTTFRLEGTYTDKRHPDEIKFAETIEQDLSRRDFTVNALALQFAKGEVGELIDPFGGMEDIESKTIRTVGSPEERFNEDALRLMRAVRLAVELNFEIEFETRRAIVAGAGLLEAIAKERIRDEFIKIIMADRAAEGIRLLEELDLLRYVMPEFREGIGTTQNKHHIYTVFDHNVRALDYAVKQRYSLDVRMASLLHDVGKPRAKRGEGPNATFYGHEYVGAKMALGVLDRLRFRREFIERVAHLVRSHMFYYNVGEVTAAGVRRFLSRVGVLNIDDIMRVREADRIGSGVPKAVVYKMRHLLFMIEKVRRDPVSPKMLAINGTDVMRMLDIPPGPRIGQVLLILLEDVLDNPEKNNRDYLEARAKELGGLPDGELKNLGSKAKGTRDEFETGAEEEMKKKYYV